MTKSPLYNQLKNHFKLNRSSLHMPGHKNNCPWLNDLINIDITEIPDTDSLFECSGAILEAEKRCADVLGVKRTLFSAGGCTLAIQAMLRLCSYRGSKILMHRSVHRSAVQTLALLGMTPIWLYPKQDAGLPYLSRITAKQVEYILSQESDICAVYLTSPDYFGIIQPVEEIAEVCHKYNIPLVVDNAHGPHLFYTSVKHPIQCGADMTADSPHKTLPVLTGGAWLHINNDKFINDSKNAMALFGSTSPSYPIMASLDLCVDWLENEAPSAYPILEEKVSQIKKLALDYGYTVPQGLTDPSRITLNTSALSIDGNHLAEQFRENLVEPEHSDESNVILIPSPFNTEEDFTRLEKAIKLSVSLPKNEIKAIGTIEYPEAVMSVREAILSPYKVVAVDDAIGKIAQDIFCPCPPGVPVVMPGERINECAADLLKRYGFSFVKVVQ